MHLSRAAVKVASAAASISFHLNSLTVYRLKESTYATKTSQEKLLEPMPLQPPLHARLWSIYLLVGKFGLWIFERGYLLIFPSLRGRYWCAPGIGRRSPGTHPGREGRRRRESPPLQELSARVRGGGAFDKFSYIEQLPHKRKQLHSASMLSH